MFKELVPPVQEGEIYKEMLIESEGRSGDGVTKVNGFVIFVPRTLKDDVVDIKITKVLSNFGFAELVR